MVTENESVPLPPYDELPLSVQAEMLLGCEWMDVNCPSCGNRLATLNGAHIKSARYEAANCECGFNDPFEWINPDFEGAYGRARIRLGLDAA